MRQILYQAHRERKQASVNAHWLYSQLVSAIEDEGRYQLNTAYNGLKIVSIWEAKPIAWRPSPIYQYDFHLPNGSPEPDWILDTDILHDYFNAYLVEKEAWSRFTACYIDAVYAWLQNPNGADAPTLNTTGQTTERLFRFYEVKATP